MAIFSPLITIKLWQRTNRPIVWAVIESIHTKDKNLINYNLTVINVGNRPAVDIQLHVDPKELNSCFVENIEERQLAFVQTIKLCFNENSKIPLLVNGERNSSMFGFYDSFNHNYRPNIWKYESTLPIKITYKDHEGKKYKSKAKLFLIPVLGILLPIAFNRLTFDVSRAVSLFPSFCTGGTCLFPPTYQI